MHMTERITRIDEDTLEYAFTVVDPDTWAEPWGGVFSADGTERPAVRVRVHGGRLRHGKHSVRSARCGK